MNAEKTLQAFDAVNKIILAFAWDVYELVILPARIDPKKELRFNDGDRIEALAHLLFMCEMGRTFVSEGRMEKAMRWLGFIQGALWTGGLCSIQEMKHVNMPDEEKPSGEPSAR